VTKTLRLLAIALLAALVLPATSSADVPKGADWTQKIIETDGEPTLHVDVFRPKGFTDAQKTPVILAIGPYFGHGGQSTPDVDPTGFALDQPGTNRPSNRFDDMIEGAKVFDRGYSVVYVDLRGFGASEGCNDFGGRGEQNDVKRAVEWAASQPWSTGKVGMWGKSYDAWTQVMALDEKPKGLAAAIIQAPIIDGYRTLHQNGVHYDSGWYTTPALYQQIDLIPPPPGSQPDYIAGYASGLDPACYAQNIALQNSKPDWSDPFWQERNLPGARGSDVPVMWSHGFLDANTKPDNFMDVWSKLTGPKHGWFGQWDHVRGNEDTPAEGQKTPPVGRKGFLDETMRWFDRYLKGDANAKPETDPIVTVQEADGKFRPENAWPPADSTPYAMPLKAGTYRDEPNNSGQGQFRVSGLTYNNAPYGVGIWSATRPFEHETRIAGVTRAKLDVQAPSGRSHVSALLYDVDPKGVGQLITRGAHAITGSGTVDVELYPQDWTIKPGNRLLMIVSSADMGWWLPPYSGNTVTVKSGTASIPFLRYERTRFLEGGRSRAMDSRRNLQFDIKKAEANQVDMTLPPKAVPFPPGEEPMGGNQISRAQADALLGPRNTAVFSQRSGKMGISVRRARVRGRKMIAVYVTGATRRKLRVELRRRTRVVGRSTVTVRGGAARALFRQRGHGKFNVLVRSTAKKHRLLARTKAFVGWPAPRR
jgi:uncharacterized protein